MLNNDIENSSNELILKEILKESIVAQVQLYMKCNVTSQGLVQGGRFSYKYTKACDINIALYQAVKMLHDSQQIDGITILHAFYNEKRHNAILVNDIIKYLLCITIYYKYEIKGDNSNGPQWDSVILNGEILYNTHFLNNLVDCDRNNSHIQYGKVQTYFYRRALFAALAINSTSEERESELLSELAEEATEANNKEIETTIIELQDKETVSTLNTIKNLYLKNQVEKFDKAHAVVKEAIGVYMPFLQSQYDQFIIETNQIHKANLMKNLLTTKFKIQK